MFILIFRYTEEANIKVTLNRAHNIILAFVNIAINSCLYYHWVKLEQLLHSVLVYDDGKKYR